MVVEQKSSSVSHILGLYSVEDLWLTGPELRVIHLDLP